MDMAFIKVLNMSISASWLVLMVLILRLLLKKSPKWISVALWALVAVRLICPFSIESAMSLIPSAETIPETIIYAQTPAIDSGVEVIDQAVNASMAQSLRPQIGDSVNPIQVHLFVQENIWCLGMAVMLGWAMISYLRLKKKVAASIDVGNGVYICDYIATPFILGIVKPKIYLPSAMEPDSASHVLAHERSHMARKDHWWKPFGYLLLTIHWFNPILWLAYILLCRDIELACDEKVIRNMEAGQKKAYSEALLNCSVNRRHIAACPLAFGEVGVKNRIKTVLNYRKPAFWIVLVAILALIMTAVCFLTDPVREPGSNTDPVQEVDMNIEEVYDVSGFYWAEYLGLTDAITLTYEEDGRYSTAQVVYDGEKYTISDDAGSRSYQYCVKSQAESPKDTYTEYFFLTDDPDMTVQKYLEGADILPTEVMYIDSRSFGAAEEYGDIPASMKKLWEAGVGGIFCPKSMFQTRNQVALSSSKVAYSVARVDYDGNLLCEVIVKGVPYEVLELDDGGFVLFTSSYTDGLYTLPCYDFQGNLRWTYSFAEEGSVYIASMHQRNGDIYCFGEVRVQGDCNDIYIWRISPDGELKQKIKIGGSDFESVYRVLQTEDGFTMYGSTQSNDGDLSFSKNGYGVGFRAEISDDLILLHAEVFESQYSGMIGYHAGQPVFYDDPILKISRKDNFPEGVTIGSSGIFDWEEGYVIVRTLNFDRYDYQNPLISMSPSYGQRVMTGYDAQGNPMWQTVGPVFGG